MPSAGSYGGVSLAETPSSLMTLAYVKLTHKTSQHSNFTVSPCKEAVVCNISGCREYKYLPSVQNPKSVKWKVLEVLLPQSALELLQGSLLPACRMHSLACRGGLSANLEVLGAMVAAQY